MGFEHERVVRWHLSVDIDTISTEEARRLLRIEDETWQKLRDAAAKACIPEDPENLARWLLS